MELNSIIEKLEGMPRYEFAKKVMAGVGIKYEFSKLVVADDVDDLLNSDWAVIKADFEKIGILANNLTKSELQNLARYIAKKALTY